jgi:hypothetical protein
MRDAMLWQLVQLTLVDVFLLVKIIEVNMLEKRDVVIFGFVKDNPKN